MRNCHIMWGIENVSKDKFLKNHASSFSDYELIELMLFSSIPRKDVKPLAKELLSKFGNLNNLVNTSREKLSEVKGTNQNFFISLQIIKELMNRVLMNQVINTNVIGSWGALLEYLKFNMGNLQIEQFRVLFLRISSF